jgi:hypothetical protein
MAAVEGPPLMATERWRGSEGGCSRRPDEPRDRTLEVEIVEIAEQQRRPSVEQAVPAEEATITKDAAPGLTNEGGTN